jgi:hypothetical protein
LSSPCITVEYLYGAAIADSSGARGDGDDGDSGSAAVEAERHAARVLPGVRVVPTEPQTDRLASRHAGGGGGLSRNVRIGAPG